MKNYYWVLPAFCLMLNLFSCKQETKEQTVSGKVVDATMNNIMLVTTSGDTLNISTMDTDPAIVPGVLLEDVVNITYKPEKAGESEILKAVKLEVTTHSPYYYIQSTWVEPNPIKPTEVQGITLKEGGAASSVGMETLLFSKWVMNGNNLMLTSQSIGSGQTLEGTDTLQIIRLDTDSLILSRPDGFVWRLGRQK